MEDKEFFNKLAEEKNAGTLKKLLKLAFENNLSQTKLAEQLGINKQYLNRLVNGKRQMSNWLRLKIEWFLENYNGEKK